MTTGSAQDVKSGFLSRVIHAPVRHAQHSDSKRSYFRFEPVFVKRDMGVYMIDLEREICKPVLRGMA
jgi:hypothetical protein